MPNDPISKVRLPNNTTYDIHDSRIDSVTSLENAVSASYSDVKTMITNGTLVPGTWYRITDYVATTTDTESRSVNHPFDIIVMASAGNKLLEEGYAALHSGDTYFANNNLAAWKVWYSIDNDTTRFAWADAINGKGVVYRLIDEYNNDVPYDFKSIQFKRYAVTAESAYTASIGQLNGLCIGQPNAKGFTLNTSTYEWYYTFTALGSTFSADKTDGSLTGKAYDVVFSRSMQRNTLLNNVFANGTAVQTLVTQLGLTFSDPDYVHMAANLTFADASYKLTVIGDICNSEANETQMRENLFVGSVRHNVFKSDFQNNTIVGDYIFNTAQLSDNVIFVKDTMARVAIERLSENYIYTSGSFYNSKGISVTNNTFVISSGSDSSVFGTDFGVQFRNNTINGRFNGNSFQYNTTGNTFGANVLMCTFNTTQFSYNTINSPMVSCVFAGPVEYVDIPAVTDKNFAYVDSGALRGVSDSHIKLGNSEFFVSVLTGLQRRIAIESNDDGQIVATWKDADGVSTGVYATSAESRSDTWHNIPASDDGAKVFAFNYSSWGYDIVDGHLNIPLATYEAMVEDAQNEIPVILRLQQYSTSGGVVTSGTCDDFYLYENVVNGAASYLCFSRVGTWSDTRHQIIRINCNGSSVSFYYYDSALEVQSSRVNSITGAGSSFQYPSTSAVVNYVAAHGGLPTPYNSGLFLESYWDVASSSNKWKISEDISVGSPGTLYVDTQYGIRASQFATALGPQGSSSQILINSSGLVGEAYSSDKVFSNWSWIKYRNSYNPQHYVTLQQTLDELPLLPAVTSSDSGRMLYVGYDSEYGHYWSKNSPFHFESLNMVGDPYMGIVLQNSVDEQLSLSYAGMYYQMYSNRSAEYINWNWIQYNYYDSTAGTRLDVGLQDTLDTKQATLVSGTNIKTINNQSLLGSGNITISGGDTSTCVHKTGDETVGGDKTFTDNIGVVDADHIVYSGGGGGGGFTRGYASVVCDDRDYLEFTGITEAPAAFIVTLDLSGDSSDTGIIAVIGDSTGTHAVYSADSTHQHNYTTGCTTTIWSGFAIECASSIPFILGATYKIVYYYGEGTLTFKTSQVQPGSGVTALTFTGTDLTEVPAMYALMLETQVNNESYRRVAYYTNEGGGASATPMGVSFFSSQIHNTTSSFTASYNNGLNINSGGTNAGGYFHNPGTYTLYYLMASDIGSGGGGGFQSLGDELDDIRDTIGDIATILASI